MVTCGSVSYYPITLTSSIQFPSLRQVGSATKPAKSIDLVPGATPCFDQQMRISRAGSLSRKVLPSPCLFPVYTPAFPQVLVPCRSRDLVQPPVHPAEPRFENRWPGRLDQPDQHVYYIRIKLALRSDRMGTTDIISMNAFQNVSRSVKGYYCELVRRAYSGGKARRHCFGWHCTDL